MAPAAFAHGFEERRVPEVAQMYDVRRDESIRQSTGRTSVTPSNASEEEDEELAEAEEGRILTRLHRSRERSRELIEKKKASMLKLHGCLKCEACSFDFKATYGPRGARFIEAHHIKPVHTLILGSKTRLEDLALLCSNCHRMVHVQRPWLTVQELKQLLRH